MDAPLLSSPSPVFFDETFFTVLSQRAEQFTVIHHSSGDWRIAVVKDKTTLLPAEREVLHEKALSLFQERQKQGRFGAQDLEKLKTRVAHLTFADNFYQLHRFISSPIPSEEKPGEDFYANKNIDSKKRQLVQEPSPEKKRRVDIKAMGSLRELIEKMLYHNTSNGILQPRMLTRQDFLEVVPADYCPNVDLPPQDFSQPLPLIERGFFRDIAIYTASIALAECYQISGFAKVCHEKLELLQQALAQWAEKRKDDVQNRTLKGEELKEMLKPYLEYHRLDGHRFTRFDPNIPLLGEKEIALVDRRGQTKIFRGIPEIIKVRSLYFRHLMDPDQQHGFLPPVSTLQRLADVTQGIITPEAQVSRSDIAFNFFDYFRGNPSFWLKDILKHSPTIEKADQALAELAESLEGRRLDFKIDYWIRNFGLKDSGVTDRAFIALSNYASSLTFFNSTVFSGQLGFYFLMRAILKLETFPLFLLPEMAVNKLLEIGVHLNHLKSVIVGDKDFGYSHDDFKWSDETLLAVSKASPALEELPLTNNTHLKEETILTLIEEHPSLRTIELSFINSISDRVLGRLGEKCKKLEWFSCNSETITQEGLERMISQLPQLRLVRLSPNLKPLSQILKEKYSSITFKEVKENGYIKLSNRN